LVTEGGVVLGLIYYSLGFAVLLLYSVIRTIPRGLEDAAAISGASRARVFWRVVLPLSLPGVVAVALTVFSLSMGAFAAAALMGGGRVLTLPVLIYRTVFTETKYATASTLSVILLVLVLVLNLVSVLLIARLRPAVGGRSTTGLAPRLERLRDLVAAARVAVGNRVGAYLAPLGRFALRAWIGWVYLLLFAPLFVIVGASLNGGPPRSGALVFPPRRISLDWYLTTPPEHLHAFGVSIALALTATALACLFALPAGLGLARSGFRARDAAAALFRIPLQIPVVIIGLSFFYTYYALDDVLGGLLIGSFAGLVIAHFFIVAPFVIGSVTAVLQRFDTGLEEAAASLGATRWRAFRRVTLPVIAPGVFAGAVYAFMVSFGDVPISLFLAGSGNTPFPVVIFHLMEIDFDARVLSSSTLVMAFGFALLLAVQKLVGLDNLTRAEAGVRG
jgi:ABC-type spermidine/putrescine transport system permease subunit II